MWFFSGYPRLLQWSKPTKSQSSTLGCWKFSCHCLGHEWNDQFTLPHNRRSVYVEVDLRSPQLPSSCQANAITGKSTSWKAPWRSLKLFWLVSSIRVFQSIAWLHYRKLKEWECRLVGTWTMYSQCSWRNGALYPAISTCHMLHVSLVT